MNSKRVLLFVTSHDQLGNTGKQTGFHYTELAAPYLVFENAGFEVLIGSVAGGEPPYHPGTLNLDDEAVARFQASEQAKNALRHSRSAQEIIDIGPESFDAIYLCGGHGTMWDFPDNVELQQILSTMFEHGRILSAVCHGVVGLVNVRDRFGQPIVKGREITGFSNDEEEALGLVEKMPFLLETRLKGLEAKFICSQVGKACVVEDGTLITGQNDKSAEGVAKAVARALGQDQQSARISSAG